MGCSSNKENVIIEVTYCGGCGWTLPAKRVCESIKKRLPKSVLDCRPE
jgi:predicted Rdx family selenoprotein